MVKKKQTLKELQTQKSQLEAQLQEKEREYSFIERQISNLKKRLDSIYRRISSLSDNNLKVSEHAILRFLEYEMLIDMEEIKKRILTKELIELQSKLGSNCELELNSNIKAIIKDNVIVTLIKKENTK